MSHANYSLTFRAVIPARVGMLGQVMAAIGDAEGQVGGVDIVRSAKEAVTRDITVYARDVAHGEAIRAALEAVEGVRVESVNDRVFLSHQGGVVGMQNRVAAYQPRRPLDGLHPRRGPRLHGDPPRLRPGLGLHDQGQQRHGRERRQLGRGPGRPRPRGLAAGPRGQVRVHAPPRGHRRLPAAGRPARPGRDRRGRRALLVGVRGDPPERHRGAALLRGPAPAGRAPRRPGLPRGPAGDGRRRARRPHQRPDRRRQGPRRTRRSWWRASARAARPWCGCWSRPAPAT